MSYRDLLRQRRFRFALKMALADVRYAVVGGVIWLAIQVFGTLALLALAFGVLYLALHIA